MLLKLYIGNEWNKENTIEEKRQEEFGIRMTDILPRGQREVKGCLLSVNMSETLWLLTLENDQTLPRSFHQQTEMDVNMEDLNCFDPESVTCQEIRTTRNSLLPFQNYCQEGGGMGKK